MSEIVEIFTIAAGISAPCLTAYAIASKITQAKKKANISASDWKIHKKEFKELQEQSDKHERIIATLETSIDFIKESLKDIKKYFGIYDKKKPPADNGG